MTLPPPPRRVGLTAFGIAGYGFLTMLIAAMLIGPPLSFVFKDKLEQTLLDHGVLTHFDVVASEPAHDGRRIAYSFELLKSQGAAGERVSGHSTISAEDDAIFADPRKRLLLYDPAAPENAVPVTSRAAFAERRAFDRKFAIWFCPSSAAFILLFAAIGIRRLRRRMRLLRVGFAATPSMTHPVKSRPCVEFTFTDPDGALRAGRQCFNFRIGIGADFKPFMRDAVVFHDPRDPGDFELFLPEISAFRFAER